MQRGQSARNETVCRIPGMTVKAEGQAGEHRLCLVEGAGCACTGFSLVF